DSLAPRKEGGGQGSRTGHEKPNVPQISRILLEVVGKALVHGWHAEKHGSAGLELAEDILRTEWHEDGAAAGDQGTVERNRQAVNVEQRQRQHQPVRSGPS